VSQEDYYEDKLSADRLRRCYEIAPARVRQYLAAEIEYVLRRIKSEDIVLELGCGYGRVLARLAQRAKFTVGIDNSLSSLQMAASRLQGASNCRLLASHAAAPALRERAFDIVVCVQNGISAFHVNQQTLINECIRVTRTGGRVLLSTYSDKFWPTRLEWFRLQSDEGLVGEIDWSATGDGVIACRDGFTATTVDQTAFVTLASRAGQEATVEEVDESSLFCEIVVRR
jgi:2-polyprenyl-6-hydroxyphenyl methylase/3-demethylubiquinone-9 3-methyltransferase